MSEPLISVIMGVYNQLNREELRLAVDSILAQSMSDIELIIYNDGSNKTESEYITQFRKLDDRIVVIGHEINNGLAFSLNECIKFAKGKYVARMDADDYSAPERLRVQYNFLEENPEYAFCGCNAKLYDAKGIWGERKMPEIPEEKDFLRFSPYIHPTVMYRKEILIKEQGYRVDETTLRCEDYEIFMRLFRHGYKGYNIQRFLFAYKEDIVSFKRRSFKSRFNEARLRYRNFKEMHILWFKGWGYVLRPIIAAFVPKALLLRHKRKGCRLTDEKNRNTSESIGFIRDNFRREFENC